MSKQGMARPDWMHTSPKNDTPPVAEIQGKAKHGSKRARPIIAGSESPELKVYHSHPHSEQPISNAFGPIDSDLARDNLENEFDLTAADLQDL